MTTNEKIAEFLEKKIVDRGGTEKAGDIARGTNGSLFLVGEYGWMGGFYTTYTLWDPEHDIRCWHGPDGPLAKIEEKGLADTFMRHLCGIVCLGRDVVADGVFIAFWPSRRAEAPQLAAALVKVIEEAPDA